MVKVFQLTALAAPALAYNNGAPHSRLPALGWSSWVALGPGAEHPIFDFCDETNVKNAMDAFFDVGLYDAGYRHFHLDDVRFLPAPIAPLFLLAPPPLTLPSRSARAQLPCLARTNLKMSSAGQARSATPRDMWYRRQITSLVA